MKKPPSTRKKTPPPSRTSGAQRNAVPLGYGQLLDELKTRVRAAQLKAAVAANRELIQLYWDIGRMIVERQQQEGWGASVIDRLAADLQKAFPGLKGLSVSNVSRMRTFYRAYRSDRKKLSQAVIELAAPISAQAVPKLKGKNSAQPVPKSRGRKAPQLVGTF